MAKDIAIVIGISEYTNAQTLSGCKVDADSIKTLLEATSKYDEILLMEGKVNADEIDQKLPEFIKKYKSETIGEVFFYYSGHGCVLNDAFAYVASDYDHSKPNTTTISNDNVDRLLKSLNANLVIKIIDACHSGTQYLKDIEMMPKYINQQKDEFTNCYFMFSSRNDQSSIATPTHSVFTRSFIQAVKNCPLGAVKYTSIAACIADDFITNPNQKPQFVHQADLTETFCVKDATIDGIVNKLLIDGKMDPNSKPIDVENESPLMRAIKQDSQSYRSEEQIFEILEKVKEGIGSVCHQKDIPELFDFEISFSKGHHGFTKDGEVGKWLSNGKHNYFAKEERSSYEQLNRGIISAYSIGQTSQKESQAVRFLDPLYSLSQSYISGFSSLIEYPFDLVSCLYKSKHINLSAFKVQMTFVCSKTELALFSYTTEIKSVEKPWDYIEVAPLSVSKIKFVDGDISKLFIEQILNGEDAIIAKLKNQFLNAPDSSIGLD